MGFYVGYGRIENTHIYKGSTHENVHTETLADTHTKLNH